MSQNISWADLNAYDPRPHRAGGQLRYCCPFCGDGYPRNRDHQSLAVGPENGLWRCWRCNENGKLTDFWEERDTRQRLPLRPLEEAVYEPEYPELDPQKASQMREAYERMARKFRGSPGAAYLESRGIPEKVAVTCGVGYAEAWKHWEVETDTGEYRQVATSRRVVFPVWGRDGELLAYQGRKIDPDGYGPKNLTKGPTSHGVFTTPGWDAQGHVLACEGPVNTLSLYALRRPGVACMGGSFPVWLLKRLQGKCLLVGTDHDPLNPATGKRPGDATGERWMELAGKLGVLPVRLRPEVEGEDWNDWLQRDFRSLQAFLAGKIDG